MDLKDTYNKIAEDWNADHAGDTGWITDADKFLSYLKPGSSILDVGSGPGYKTKYFIDRGFSVTAIDISEEMINLLKRQVPEAEGMVSDITKPLELEKKFDAIYAMAVLLHIPKLQIQKVLRNLTAALKNGGYFYISVKERFPGSSEEQIIKENDYGYEYERFFSFYTLPELQKLIKESGLKEIANEAKIIGNTHWISVIAQKN